MDELPAITPINFFQIAFSCSYLPVKGAFPRLSLSTSKKYLLPNTAALCNEKPFAQGAMGWNEEGLEFCFCVNKGLEEVFFPNITKGDSIELFIDTRNIKTSGFNTRFCHHFFFLPEAIEGRQAGEMTHFRTEDAHELCEGSELSVKTIVKKNEYTLHCHIPKQCLVGFDPQQFDRLGFAYRINRPYLESQHFCVVTADYRLEEQPSLWSQVRLIK